MNHIYEKVQNIFNFKKDKLQKNIKHGSRTPNGTVHTQWTLRLKNVKCQLEEKNGKIEQKEHTDQFRFLCPIYLIQFSKVQ